MADLPLPRGVRDLMPNEALFRNELLRKIERVFQSFGFLTIDTPSIEDLRVLKAKGGIGEDTKFIYEMKDEKIGLRFDNTMSLARYMSMHQHLPLPFKRYYIGKVWRREEPQKLRYREISQADVDIVGGESSAADAEIMAVGAAVFDALGFNCRTELNDRRVVDAVLKKLGVPAEKVVDAMRIFDKQEKIGPQKVAQMLSDLGFDKKLVEGLVEFTSLSGTNEQKIVKVEKIVGDTALTAELRKTLSLLKTYGTGGEVVFSPSIMRGLDYYTGLVFEFKDASGKVTQSLGGGGRYDNLIGNLGGKQMTAVGFAIGIDRLLETLRFSESGEYTYAKAFVAYVKENNQKYALEVVSGLRKAGVPSDVNLSSRNLSNQASYASSIKAKYLVIVGDSEEKERKMKLKNLATGEEKTLDLQEAIENIVGQ
jgi:histidyl-tRNA synthetase